METIYQPSATFHLELKLTELPPCPKCSTGKMIPLMDELASGAIVVKSWICTACKYNITLRSGSLVDLVEVSKKL